MKTLVPLLLLAVPVAAQTRQENLPLRDVALFSSGVGYFGRAGQINGDATVDLQFRAPQIADILKSLVIFDTAGTVRPVSYSIEDWLRNRPKDTDLRLDAGATPGGLLRGFQGAVLRIEKDGPAIEGRIISVNSKSVLMDKQWVGVEAVTLLTANGLQSVRLDDATSLRLVDPALDAKLRASLEKLAGNLTAQLDDGLRSVSLRFDGKGSREVRAGYLLETPAWKTSYRLVLDEKKKPYLQGWAIVENTTDDDWKDVNLSLFAGRPISFIQDLASPLWVSRVVVPPPIAAAPGPQTYGEVVEGNGVIEGYPGPRGLRESVSALPPSPVNAPQRAALRNSAAQNMGTNFAYGGISDSARRLAGTRDETNGVAVQPVAPQAQGAEAGELFEYAINGKVTLERGRAAMVPIVGSEIEGESVSVVDAANAVGNSIPATAGFRLKNVPNLALQGGPVTVFQDGTYGGDAQINGVQPGEIRLLSYAVDAGLATSREVAEETELIKVSAEAGVLTFSRRASKTTTYHLRNKTDKGKHVLIQQPIEAGWKVIQPKIVFETTPNEWRFRTDLKAKETQAFVVKLEQPESEDVTILDEPVTTLKEWIGLDVLTPEAKKAIAEIIARRNELQNVAASRAGQEAALKDIEADQSRIRNNMSQLDRNSALYKSYLDKLTRQEPQIEAIRAKISDLRKREADLGETLRIYVNHAKF